MKGRLASSTAFLSLALLVACDEQDPERFDVGDDLPVCGMDRPEVEGLPCGSAPIQLARGVGADSDVLLAVWESGLLTATRVAPDGGLGEPILETPVTANAIIGGPLVVCDFNGNGVSDVALSGIEGQQVFVVWDLTEPGSAATPSNAPAWEGINSLSCEDLDLDGFDDLLAFTGGGRVQILAGSETGFEPVQTWPTAGYQGPPRPIMSPVRHPDCVEANLVARPARYEGETIIGNEVEIFALREEGLVQRAVIGPLEDNVVAPFAVARDEGLMVLLWLLEDDGSHRLGMWQSSGPCEMDLQRIATMELSGRIRRLSVDDDRGLVKLLHEDTAGISLFAWGPGGTFELVAEVEGPAQDAVVIGAPGDEHLVVTRIDPPFFEVSAWEGP